MFILLKSKTLLAFALNTFKGKQFTAPTENLVTIFRINKKYANLRK